MNSGNNNKSVNWKKIGIIALTIYIVFAIFPFIVFILIGVYFWSGANLQKILQTLGIKDDIDNLFGMFGKKNDIGKIKRNFKRQDKIYQKEESKQVDYSRDMYDEMQRARKKELVKLKQKALNINTPSHSRIRDNKVLHSKYHSKAQVPKKHVSKVIYSNKSIWDDYESVIDTMNKRK